MLVGVYSQRASTIAGRSSLLLSGVSGNLFLITSRSNRINFSLRLPSLNANLSDTTSSASNSSIISSISLISEGASVSKGSAVDFNSCSSLTSGFNTPYGFFKPVYRPYSTDIPTESFEDRLAKAIPVAS